MNSLVYTGLVGLGLLAAGVGLLAYAAAGALVGVASGGSVAGAGLVYFGFFYRGGV